MLKKSIQQIMVERTLILDGAMGTQIFARNPTIDDYGGAQTDGCLELLNERRKEWIQEIHDSYFKVGADAVETNTFGCNEIVLAEFGLKHRVFDLNVQAANLAREVAQSYDIPKFVIGSVGPGTKILTLLQIDYSSLYKSYYEQMRGLLTGNVDAILIETSQDINQIKLAVRAAKNAMRDLTIVRPIWTQVTIENTGTMLLGSDISAALTALEPLGIDLIGINCATGPDEMKHHIAFLAEQSPFALSAQPNAGLPVNNNGNLVYSQSPKEFAKKVAQMAKDFSLNVVGGCCGTTPEHIRELVSLVGHEFTGVRSSHYKKSVSSLYSSVPLNLEPKPLYVGERTNANGSKKFRDLLAKNDFNGLVQIAKDQLKEGAHILDLCVAYVSRNEVLDMEEFLKLLVTQVNIPIMIDSTEIPVIEKALQLSPGKCIVNSINFEDGEEKARNILYLCKEYGAAVVALTIDENGMAKTCENKLKIAERIYCVAVKELGISAGDLIFDPLTFTLGSGDDEFRNSAVETLNAITAIKEKFPETKTILGLSNISFGLNPITRQILNSMMLYHAVKKGLDLAILNASKILPITRLDQETKELFENLIFNHRTKDYDPLKIILSKFSDNKKQFETHIINQRFSLSIEDRLKQDIINAEKQYIIQDCQEALKHYPPIEIINKILLAAMKTVGERFATGEMQLPFVLESAEIMKIAVKELEPFMEKLKAFTKAKLILATVKGDVHDIGKNLVEIILSNNGFDVLNLGIKQSIESIVEKYKESGAHAIGMSGLLVKSTTIMKENLVYMAEHGLSVPVILGGAALTRSFVEEECQKVYNGPVFYAFDAFDGLKIMELLNEVKKNTEDLETTLLKEKLYLAKNTLQEENDDKIIVLRRAESVVSLNEKGQSSWVRKQNDYPHPPFFGTKIINIKFEDLFLFLDEFALIRSRWGFVQGKQTEDEFKKILEQKAEPVLKQLKKQLCKDEKCVAKAIYGYFPAASDHNSIYIYSQDSYTQTMHSKREIIATFHFPRQKTTRQLCIADFIKDISYEVPDILPLQLVSLGDYFSELTKSLYAQEKFSEYFYLHGLGTELTEAFAEFIHKKIRVELGISGQDAQKMRQLFNQGYQGSRYSFGYPACPELEGNKTLLNLLEAERIHVHLSESFQMIPELSTCALICWHPQARYFST